MQEEPISCRGINGSINLTKDKLTISGVGLSATQPHDITFSDVSSVMVERKSVVPFTTIMFLAIIVLVIAKYNLLWFIINLYGVERFITPTVLVIAISCGVSSVLRLMFVNVTIRSRRGQVTVRLVPSRPAKRLARRFSELSARS